MSFSSRQSALLLLVGATVLVVVALALPSSSTAPELVATTEAAVAGTTTESEPVTTAEGSDGSATSAESTTTSLPVTTSSDGVCDAGTVNCAEIVAYDMFGPAIGTEDEYVGGATGWDPPWPNHEMPILNDGTNFRWLTGGSASNWNDPGDEQAIYARCKVVPAAAGGVTSGFLLQIRGLKSWQRVDGEWSLHQSSDDAGLEGDWYDLADFEGDRAIDASLRQGSEPGVWEIPWPADGEIFHFFMGKDNLADGHLRVLFDPDYDPARDTFYATAQMRLVAIDGAEVDLDDVKLLGNCGLDFYLNETSTRQRDYPGRPVPSAGHPRSKLLSTEWQAFNWYTVPLEQPLRQGEERTWEELRDEILADPPPTAG